MELNVSSRGFQTLSTTVGGHAPPVLLSGVDDSLPGYVVVSRIWFFSVIVELGQSSIWSTYTVYRKRPYVVYRDEAADVGWAIV